MSYTEKNQNFLRITYIAADNTLGIFNHSHKDFIYLYIISLD